MAKSRRVIGVDCDDVLFDFVPQLFRFHNEHYSTERSHTEMVHWDITVWFECDEAEKDRRMGHFYRSDEHMAIPPVKGAREALQHLSKTCELHVITARSVEFQDQTEALIKAHFPELFRAIHFTNHHHPDSSLRRSKSAICKVVGAGHLIDDALHNATDVAASGVPVLLFNRPWNQTAELPRGIVRVRSWIEIAAHLEEAAR